MTIIDLDKWKKADIQKSSPYKETLNNLFI